jgi:hypothetical protein
MVRLNGYILVTGLVTYVILAHTQVDTYIY